MLSQILLRKRKKKKQENAKQDAPDQSLATGTDSPVLMLAAYGFFFNTKIIYNEMHKCIHPYKPINSSFCISDGKM